MINDEIVQYYDYLMRLAASKCDSQVDAEDLVGDTMLAAFAYMHRGGTIENPKLLYEEYDNHFETYGYSIFVKPTLIHVLLSVLQPFDDGNTRLARLIQEVKIYQETNRLYQLKTSPKRLPYLYLSQRYYQRGPFYRSQMADIAQSPTNENWKNFIYMNLGCVEEEINVMQHTLKYFK